ncbi:hypothetical protein [Bacillus suaedae]|uniref:Uncharacterized protein n=1 Tax=Halalkalibacter suaedae TaxID=2822140 RepID=A0A940WTU6_9BACI|nr:hypothetical protein [Bacillus suaedae]MBP3950332.1 hypothetical protein [Bacillus suaedae]
MYRLDLWLTVLVVSFIQRFKKKNPLKEKDSHRLKMNLQYFAEPDDEDDLDDDDDDPEGGDPTEPDLDELLKDRKFKKQYNAKLKEHMGQRLKKFEGVDPVEYRRLKEQAEKKPGNKDEDQDDDLEKLKSKLTEKEKRLLRAERREKTAMVKEFAVENGHNPRLLARLINVDDIEMSEDGEPENLEDLFEEIEEDFPEYFGQTDDDDEDEDEEPKRKKKAGTYKPGSRQKNNDKTKKADRRSLGAERAAKRHKKEDK